MRVHRIHAFVDDQGNILHFRPVAQVPGFTHRVIINNVAMDWLASTHTITVRAATFFFTKHATHLTKETD